MGGRRKRLGGATAGLASLAILTFALLLPAGASATVIAISSGGSDGTLYPIVDGDAANDTIAVTCGTDANVKINGLDPVARFGTPGPVPIPCAAMTSVNIDGGAGDDTIDLSAMTRTAGFTEPRLCAPCPNRAYAVVTECDSNGGNDTIIASSIGTLIGGCSSGVPMAGDDLILGDAGPEAVYGGPGDDVFRGLGGADIAVAGPGDDRLNGGEGRDKLNGEAGRDRLNGGPDRDRCDGGPGLDTAIACEVERNI